ncbi:MAG TPA: glycosyltransferase [Candidatus Saccharimonadales bacterium]
MARQNFTPKVSILVPIFNVEKYLRQCLDSVVNQSLKDIEIICINDGSTDSSPEIIKEYAKSDPRFVVINKTNSGYGDSMNKGLEKANGEYIGIVESDDWVDVDMFENLYDIAVKNNVEVVKSNFYFYSGLGDTNKKFQLVNRVDSDKVINPIETNSVFFPQAAIWTGLYKKSFLDNNAITFLPTPGASYQDTGFNFKVWASATKAYLTNDAYLHYRIDNDNSSVKSKGKIFAVVDELTDMYRFAKETKHFDQLIPILFQRKYEIYMWNYGRLTSDAAREFISHVNKELKSDKENGLYDTTLLTRKEKTIFDLIVTSPNLFYLLKLTTGSKKFLKRGAKKAARTVSPAHRSLHKHQMHAAEMTDKIDNLSYHIDVLTRLNKK